ncbi:MAG: carboxypeptidase regulatory-like domain-containing protein [Candidatus Sericytochromatia bacterium]|nr:carboxypeptidase regulatory-like domain-containing protein [Candidatus Sericytochromatia bacterium]
MTALRIASCLLTVALLTATGCGRVTSTQAPRLTPSTAKRAAAPLSSGATPARSALSSAPVALTGVGAAQGQVLSQTNQAPLAGVTVVAEPGGFRGTTDAAGRFQINGLTAGNYTFQAMGSGLVQMGPAGSLVMPGQPADVPTIFMVPGNGASGITRVSYILEKEMGRSGEAPAPLLFPVGVAARGAAVLVLDRNVASLVKTGVIRQYDAEAGTFQGKFGDYSRWLGLAQMKDSVRALTLDASGRVVVIDGDKRLWRFDSKGNKDKQSELSEEATDIALDAQGNLVLAGPGGLFRLSPDGEGAQPIGNLEACRAVAAAKDGWWAISAQKVVKVNAEGQTVMEFGAGGPDGSAAFREAVDLAVDPRNGHVVVVDQGAQQVYVYDGLGNLIGNVGQGVFDKPVAATVDAGGRIYVVDQGKKKVYKFLPGVVR